MFDRRYFNILAFLLAGLLFAIVFAPTSTPSLSTFTAYDDMRPYNWYVKRNKTHDQPPLDPNMAFIEKYDGYYVDRKHASKDDKDKVLYLTFDAGYENGNVARVLDTLKEKGVPGAFFILENLIKRNPDLVLRMRDEGHIIANHTTKHNDMSTVGDINEFKADLFALSDLYRELTNEEMAKYYRPPEGRFTERNMKFAKELGYKTIFWSFAYADWDNNNQPDPTEAIELIMENTHNGAIILLHPTSKTNADILGTLIDNWRKEGYRFGTLDELTAIK